MEIQKEIRKKSVKNIMLKIKNIKKIKDTELIAANIESGILKFTSEYVEANNLPFLIEDIYLQKIDELINLLDNNIIDNILNKKIDPKKIAFMKEEELNPSKFKKIKDKKKKISEIEDKDTSVNFYKCKKCGGNRTKIRELQVERGDEPYNIFITCLDCGYVEKQ